MRVLVTGAGGQLGRDLLDAFADVEVVGLTRAELDVTDASRVDAALASRHPDVVVNAAAWTDVDACERDEARCREVNALGPQRLARSCADLGATLVTFSSDHVFGGGTPPAVGDRQPLPEDAAIAPVNAYGRAKAEGEAAVRDRLGAHHIVRTSWLFGARGRNFVDTVLRAAHAPGPLHVVDDQFGRPTFTRDLAAAVRRLVDGGRYGTVHLANAGVCTRFDLAAAAIEWSGAQIDLRRQPSSALRRDASRPAWSVLDTTLADTRGPGPLPHWRDGLDRFLAERSGAADGWTS